MNTSLKYANFSQTDKNDSVTCKAKMQLKTKINQKLSDLPPRVLQRRESSRISHILGKLYANPCQSKRPSPLMNLKWRQNIDSSFTVLK